MAQFSVKSDYLLTAVKEEHEVILGLYQLRAEIERTMASLMAIQTASFSNVLERLRSSASRLSSHESTMIKMFSTLQSVEETYRRTEGMISGNLNSANIGSTNVVSGVVSSALDFINGQHVSPISEWFETLPIAVPIGIAPSVITALTIGWSSIVGIITPITPIITSAIGSIVTMCPGNNHLNIDWGSILHPIHPPHPPIVTWPPIHQPPVIKPPMNWPTIDWHSIFDNFPPRPPIHWPSADLPPGIVIMAGTSTIWS